MYKHLAQELTDAHRNMERVLTLIRLQVDTLREGQDPEAYQLLTNAVGYMRNYPGVIHHPVEDLIFGKLMTHVPAARTVCARLHEQHMSFRRREVTLLRRILSAQSGDAESCRQVKKLGAAYCTEHANHIRSEEVEVFPQAVRYLSMADWEEIGDQSRTMIDPLLERNDLRQFDNLYDYLMTAGKNFNVH
ncbi:MAG TPA: hemerythrin domain-containing protein [Gammaproteobacteria bacterium]|jgi:hemerythrin-like domain-containing protein|nr:hemerythrin domain-containing protein [Gammaproteobacteria bacterium]